MHEESKIMKIKWKEHIDHWTLYNVCVLKLILRIRKSDLLRIFDS